MAHVTIVKMRTRAGTGKLKAFFTVAIDALEIDDMRLIFGDKGPFVGFPSKKITRQDGSDSWINTVRLRTDDQGQATEASKQLFKQITDAALAEYNRRGGESAEAEEDDLPF